MNTETEKKPRTLVELTNEALLVQDACNLSGVVIAWARAIVDLRIALGSAGTDEINTHFVNVLWADKVAHLTKTQHLGDDNVYKAYNEAYKVVGR
jgi:hypothetical protein